VSSADPATETAPYDPNTIVNIPNAITFSRLILAFILLVMIDLGDMWISCAIVFVVGVTTDVIDGYLARKWNQITVLGRITDPFVDKVIIGGTLIFLTKIPESGVTPWVTFIVIAREMFITGLRSVLEGHGVDFSAKWSGKLKMFVQSVCIPFCILSLSQSFLTSLADSTAVFLLIRDALLWAVIVITIYSGAEYCWRGWRLLQAQNQESFVGPR